MKIIDDLKKSGISLQDNSTHKDGFWSEVCTGLQIPNNRNNRYRVHKAYEYSKVCTYHVNPQKLKALFMTFIGHSMNL